MTAMRILGCEREGANVSSRAQEVEGEAGGAHLETEERAAAVVEPAQAEAEREVEGGLEEDGRHDDEEVLNLRAAGRVEEGQNSEQRARVEVDEDAR